MVKYVDYQFYTDSYRGAMPRESFERFVVRASRYIDKITFGRIADLDDMPEGVKWACCEMCETLKAESDSRVDGKDVKSVSNAGYSVTYVSSADGAAGNTRSKLYDIAKLYLPVELLSFNTQEGSNVY